MTINLAIKIILRFLSILSAHREIEENYNSTISDNPGFKSYFHNRLAYILQNCLSPDSSLFRFFRRKGKERPGQKDCWAFVCFNVWYQIQELIYLFIIDDKSIIACTEDYINVVMKAITNKENPCDYICGFQENVLLRIDDIKDEIDKNTPLMTEVQIVHAEKFISSAIEPIKQLGSYNDNQFRVSFQAMVDSTRDIYANALKVSVIYLNLLFELLNTCFLVESKKKRIVELLKNSVAKKLIQQQYDYFRSGYPDTARDYVFVETIKRDILSEDVDWNSPADKKCFNLKWELYKVKSLYDSLLNTFIDGKTDIRDFFYTLTGKKINYSRDYVKVNWIHKEKRSLALFIGELIKEESRNDKLKIPTQASLFLYKGQDVKFHSTTEYWDADNSNKYKELKASISKAKHLEFNEEQI